MVKIQGKIISRIFYLNINSQTFCRDRLMRKSLRPQDNKFHKTNILTNLKENNKTKNLEKKKKLIWKVDEKFT